MICTGCAVEKSEDAFTSDGRGGKRRRCRSCEATQRRGETLPADDVPLIVALGDIHFPFHHKEALNKAIDIIAEIQPDYVIQLGDLYDLFAFSRYPRSLNVTPPDVEISEGRAHALWMWSRIRAAAPQAHCVQLSGNHDDRVLKRCLERLPEAETFIVQGIRDMFAFEGVETIHDSAMEYEVAGIMFHHGHLRFGAHAAKNRKPTVCGHLHRGGVIYLPEVNAWEMNVGWLGDREQPAFSYHSQKRMHGTTLGLGTIDQWGPRYISL